MSICDVATYAFHASNGLNTILNHIIICFMIIVEEWCRIIRFKIQTNLDRELIGRGLLNPVKFTATISSRLTTIILHTIIVIMLNNIQLLYFELLLI